MSSLQLGVVGLSTMGANLARNAARNGATVAVFNRTKERTDAFIAQHGTEGTFVPCTSYAALRDALTPPRPILLMVKAGQAVDDVIAEIAPVLDKGDILIDGGNSHYRDTERREKELREKGLHFFGMGVSGGEEGALNGPSMMPGGDKAAFESMEPLLRLMAADDGEGGKCVTHCGPGGAGHFVKMVHNGIEYAIMQMIAESYDLLRTEGKLNNAQLAALFAEWNTGEDLQSFLVEITAAVFRTKDDLGTGKELVDFVRDRAAQKGTGRWTTEAAMDFGVPLPSIASAVDARILSGDVDLRARSAALPSLLEDMQTDASELRVSVRSALALSVICAYGQGFELLSRASETEKWQLPLAEIARIWRGGCIIRSVLLKTFQQSLAGDPAAKKRIFDWFAGQRQQHWRHTVALGALRGVPLPAHASALAYYDAIRRPRLPQNLIQSQRDLFGAHTFERTDRDGTFHAHWA